MWFYEFLNIPKNHILYIDTKCLDFQYYKRIVLWNKFNLIFFKRRLISVVYYEYIGVLKSKLKQLAFESFNFMNQLDII